MQAFRRWVKRKWINFLIYQVFVAVKPDDILQQGDGGVWQFNGKPIPRETMERLRSDAERLHKSLLWQMISQELRYKASDLIMYKSATIEDTLFGKALLYWIETCEKILAIIRRF